jgi:Cof subfamily protein (haloacid dehalogenase superfamily)
VLPKECIIYSDIDGTYLKSWDHDAYVGAPKNNIEAINSFVNEGGLFGSASGREYTGILKCFEGVCINMPIVQNNGAIIYDHINHKIVDAAYFDKEEKEELYNYAKKTQNVWLCASTLDVIWDVLLYDERDKGAFDLVRPKMTYDEYMNKDIAKTAFVVKKELMSKVVEDSKQFYCYEKLNFLQSSPIYDEIVVKGIDKGKAIKKAVDYAKANNRKLICIGDYYNDVSMLKEADIAVCPSNSPEDIKAMCNYVVSSNDEGALADLIDRVLKEIN